MQALNRKVIGAGYTKRGEMATEEDAIILGLAASDADKIFICDRDKNLAMFHFRDAESVPQRVSPVMEEARELNRKLSSSISSASEDCLPGGLFASSPSPPPRSASQLDLPISEEGIEIEQSRGPQADSLVSHIRGWIVNIDTHKLVCRSFSEGSVVFVNPEQFATAACWDQWEFKPYREGTTIRIFWDQEQWRLSTHRKIDASTSRIPGVEIEVSKLFADSCPGFNYDLLSKDVIYVLQIVHRDNQIMNPEPVEQPYVCHLASISAANTLEPMQLISLDTTPQIPCFTYLNKFTKQEAFDVLANGRCIIARRGYEIIQVAPQSLAKLMEIRGHDKAPYIPAPLMYLRLSEEDRPLLIHAVPYHVKPLVTAEVMTAYIQDHSRKLAHFCACALQAKLFTSGLPLTKTLKWLVNDIHLKNKHTKFDKIYNLYMEKIVKLVAVNGTTAYRCFRDVEDTNAKLLKLAAKHDEPSTEKLAATEESIATDFVNDTRKVALSKEPGKQRRRPKKPAVKAGNGPKTVSVKTPVKAKVPQKKPEKPVGEKKAVEKPKGIDRRTIKKEFVVGTDPDEAIAQDFFEPSKPRIKK